MRLPLASVVAWLGLLACDRMSRAPSPMEYRWPERFAYRLEHVAETRSDTVGLVRYAETKRVLIAARDEEFRVWHDSLLKSRQERGRPATWTPYAPEDTLDFLVVLGRYGELSGATLGCDPAVPACAEALPSAIRLELRRIVPRLSVWPVPRGGSWTDTLSYDDASRSRGARGSVVTTYRAASDTVVGGRAYWVLEWRARRISFRRATGERAIAPEVPVDEMGVTLVDKQRVLPAYSSWAGEVAATEELRALGATGTVFRGRAYLLGSPFDSALAEGRRTR